MPRDHWLRGWEKAAILDFERRHPLEGYRRLAFMMLDADVVAVSPRSVYRVLRAAGRLRRWNGTVSRKGTGFVQPLRPHEHWRVDVSYINVCGTFYYYSDTDHLDTVDGSHAVGDGAAFSMCSFIICRSSNYRSDVENQVAR